MLRTSLLTLALVGLPLSVHATEKTERRCGWFENPSPANATLTDRDGTWQIATQGGYQAKGNWPRFSAKQWVTTHGAYGYGCSCMTVSTDAASRQLNNLTKAAERPLAACRNDPALQEPSNPQVSTKPGATKGMRTYLLDGVRFSYPQDWKVRNNKQCLNLESPDGDANEEYTLNLCIQHGTLEQAADSMIFSLEDGIWMRSAGRDAPSPVDVIEGPGWKGLQTTQTCGISDPETGFHAAGGTCLMAIVYNARTQLLFDTVGYYEDFDTISAIIRSVRFDKQ